MGKAKAAVKVENDLNEDELAAMLGMDGMDEAIAAEFESVIEDAAVEWNEVSDEPVVVELAAVEPESVDEPVKKVVKLKASSGKPSEIVLSKVAGFADYAVINESVGALKGAQKTAWVDEYLASMDALPKKVAEKAVNAFVHLHTANELSVYTLDAVRYLQEKGSVTVAELKAHFAEPGTGVRNKGYSQGTAGAQSSQMKALLPFLGVAKCDGNTLTLEEGSYLVDLLAKAA